MQLAVSLVINTALVVLRLLPLSVAVIIGRIGGGMAYFFDHRHRHQVYQNLKFVFAGDMTPDQIRNLTYRYFVNLGANVSEFLRLPAFLPAKAQHLIRIEGDKESFETGMRAGQGAVMMTAHFGNWEMIPSGVSLLGFPQNLIYNVQKNASILNELMMKCRRQAYRHYGSITVYERGLGARDLLRSLEKNEVIGMVVDQGGKDGIPVDFLGRKASFSTGGMRLALKAGSPIFVGGIRRERGLNHCLFFRRYEPVFDSSDEKENVAFNLQRVADLIGQIIRQYPEQYMWMYKIWKFDASRNIMILDDGRAGHLRQSQGVSKIISQEISKRDGTVSEKIVSVVYRNTLSKNILILCSWIGPVLPVGLKLKLLKLFVTPETFKELTSMKADIVISAGSLNVPVNYFISREHAAKNISILRPSLLPYSRFNLTILPRHDLRENVKTEGSFIFTKGAVNLIDDNYLKNNSEKLLQQFSHLKLRNKFKIGVLLGGDTKNYVLDENMARVLVHQLKEAAEQLDADILLTTSRRTSAKVEKLLTRELKKYPRCHLLIIANRNNVPEAVGGILGLSDVLVVSGDSISMVSESAASGKKTVVFPVKKRSGSGEEHKHNQFIDRLNSEGYILCSSLKMIQRSIFDLAKNKISTRKLDDDEAIRKGILRVI